MLASVQIDVAEGTSYARWVKAANGNWVVRRNDGDQLDTPPSQHNNAIAIRSDLACTNREESQARNVRVTGSKGQRRLSVCVSEFLNHMCIIEAAYDIRRQTYLYDLMTRLMTNCLSKISGTSHMQLFKILETIVDQALESELHVSRTKSLLDCAWTSLTRDSTGRIGCKTVWNRHIQTVAKLRTKVQEFSYTERAEDGEAHFLDLPKECIFEIMLKLSNPADVINLGKTCSDLYHISNADLIWEDMAEFHYNDKQMATFTYDADFSEGVPWKDLFSKCFRKYGLKQIYADQMVICSACKTLHWLMLGHHCWGTAEENAETYLEPVSPTEIIQILT